MSLVDLDYTPFLYCSLILMRKRIEMLIFSILKHDHINIYSIEHFKKH